MLVALLGPAAYGAINQQVLVTLALMKQSSAAKSLPYSVVFPQSCTNCEMVRDDAFSKQDAREIVLALLVPAQPNSIWW